MQTVDPILAKEGFLKNLKHKQLEKIAGCAFDARFVAEQFLFREGEAANNFYIITHGKVALEVFVPGRGPVTIETLGEGDVVGWSWLFPPYRWHFDGRALELTRVIAFDARCLRGMCETDHDLGYELMKHFSHVIMERLQATRLRLVDVYGSHQG
jgi:CRP-like cAMP-binding protein